MECQNRTISRGSASIFSRLRKEGIDVSPNTSLVSGRGDLKLMFSPRNTWPSSHFEDGVNTNPAFWPLSKFTSTERLVLLTIVSLLPRVPCCVPSHRIRRWYLGLVLCGSANINERSQRGDRDSELLSVIRDTDMIDGCVPLSHPPNSCSSTAQWQANHSRSGDSPIPSESDSCENIWESMSMLLRKIN